MKKKFVWASSIVKTKIFTENPIIRINGYLPEETVKKKCNIEIYANKNIISKQSISRGSYFSINSKLPSSVVGNLVDFTFNSDCRIKSSKDKRDLSYILNGIKNK